MQIELAVGETTTLDGVTVGFDGITEDSRCPIGTDCLWEGQAIASLWLRRTSGAATERFSLTLRAGHADLAIKVVSGTCYTLLAVDPHPDPAVRIDPQRYVIKVGIG